MHDIHIDYEPDIPLFPGESFLDFDLEAIDFLGSMITPEKEKRLREIIEDHYAVEPSGTEDEKRRLIDKVFRKETAAITSIFHLDGLPYIFRDNTVLRRRKSAVYNLICEAGDVFPDESARLRSIGQTLAAFEASIPRQDYDSLDIDSYITLGAAIWILDEIRRTGNVHRLYQFLPTDFMEVMNIDFPDTFYDPCFENDLIRSVMYVIKCRNALVAPEWGNIRTYNDAAAADPRRKENETEFRRNFDGILSLLDEERMVKAGERFKEKQREVQRIFLRSMYKFEEKEQPVLDDVRSPASSLMVSSGRESGKGSYIETLKALADLYRKKTRVHVFFAFFFDMLYDEVKEESGMIRLAKDIRDFIIDDPYELCFGLLYLTDKGDDAPWLMKSGYCVIYTAASYLPWFRSPFENVDNVDEDWELYELTYNEGGWKEFQEENGIKDHVDYYEKKYEGGGENLAQRIFAMTGTVLPRNLHPLEQERLRMVDEGMDENLSREIAGKAEVLFLSQFRLHAENLTNPEWIHRDGEDYDIDLFDDMEDEGEGIPDGEEDDGNLKEDRENKAADGAPLEENPEPEDAEEEIRRYKKEIKGLKKALSELQRHASETQTKNERELSALRREHRELADLRELFFNREQGEEDDKKDSEVSFPYETKKRTVVFGGHDTFLKAFRPKFPNVRFVDASQLNFSPEIVRNADVVWIQNNRISHSQYYGIINAARKHGIQVRYFPYASAEKCAVLMAMEDEK